MTRAFSGQLLLAAAILCGGLRDPRLAALGEAAVFALIWLRRPRVGIAAPWLAWLAWACVCAGLGAQPLAAWPGLARWSAVLAFASLAGEWDEGGREAWLRTVLACAAILAAAAFWTGAPHGFRATMTGLIPPYYNYTSFVLAAGAAAGAAAALHPGAGSSRRVAGLLVAFCAISCLLLAHSRGALLGLAAAGAVWTVRRWGAKGAGAVLAAGLVLAGAYRSGFVPESLRAAALKRGVYQEARPEIWARAAAMADAGPWRGVGSGGFGAAFRRRPVEVRGGSARWGMGTEYAHSELLQAAAETGWAGLALWLAGLGASLSVLIGRSRREPAREAAAAACAAMAVQLTVDNMLQLPGLAMLFFSALAVAGKEAGPGRRWPRWAAGAGLAFALGSWAPRALADGDPARAASFFPAEDAPREELALRALSSGKPDQADVLLAQAEERSPFNAVYPWRRALIAAARGRWDDALSRAARAAELEPGFLDDRILRAEALARLGRGREAREELARILEYKRDRGVRPDSSGYDKTVWRFDRENFDRVRELAERVRG